MTVTAKCLINSKFASSSVNTEYTTPASTKTIIDKFTATNSSGGALSIAVYIVPSGGTAGTSNLVYYNSSIGSNVTADSVEMRNQILNAGDLIAVQAGGASGIVIRASGREVQ